MAGKESCLDNSGNRRPCDQKLAKVCAAPVSLFIRKDPCQDFHRFLLDSSALCAEGLTNHLRTILPSLHGASFIPTTKTMQSGPAVNKS